MPTATITQAASIGGISISGTASRTASGQISHQVTAPAGKTVTDWAKTDADTAACNLPDDHGYSTGTFDVYWSGGVRYGVPGTVSSNALTLDGGAGTDFPASATTGVIVSNRVEINVDFDADDAEIVMVHSSLRGHIDWQDSGDATLDAAELAAGEVWQWLNGSGITNPLTGNAVDKAFVSSGSTSDSTIKLGVLYDSEV